MMRKSDRVVREILYRFYERNEPFMSQKSLAQACGLSMDTVNRLVTKLHRFHSINKKPLGFRVTDPNKILAYWAATRDLHKDIVYSTYSSDSMSEIEAGLPKEAVLTAFSGYKARFGAGPTSYDEVWAYADPREVERRFQKREVVRMNLFVLRPDSHLRRVAKDGAAPLAQIYVDFWQMGGSTADRYRVGLENQLGPRPAEALKILSHMDDG